MRNYAPAFTIGMRVAAAGQRYRVDEAPTKTAITVRFLAERVAALQAQAFKSAPRKVQHA